MNQTVAALSDELDVLSSLAVSFERFPPRAPELEARLWSEIEWLEPLAPRFVSATCGAGGSTQHRTKAIVERIHTETELVPAAHLTCIGAARQQADEQCCQLLSYGVREVHFYTLNHADLTTAICRILKTPVLNSAGRPAVTGRA